MVLWCNYLMDVLTWMVNLLKQRGMSSSAKVAARSANQTAAAYNLSSQKRASEKNRPGSTLVSAANSLTETV